MDPKFSICIPTWEQGGAGRRHLEDLILSIYKQTYNNFELVISDHSKDDEIEKYVLSLNCDVKYKRSDRKYGNGVANLNDSLDMADGDLIKIMFQDDFMYSEHCLEYIVENFDSDVKWMVCGCNHTLDDGVSFNRFFTPSWSDDIIEGNNTISSPSVLTIRNEIVEHFDENLVVMMDCEYYYRLYLKYGAPKILNEFLITNRQHPHQISNTHTSNEEDEFLYLKKLYGHDSNRNL